MISRNELEHRHAVLREVMDDAGYSALVVAGNAEYMQRGYIRYLSDWRLWHGSGYAVLPLDGDPMLMLGGGSHAHWAESIGWTNKQYSDGDKISQVISVLEAKGLSKSSIGVVGMNRIMSYQDAKLLGDSLSRARLEDATQLMDEVMAIKSQEEIARASETYTYLSQALLRVKEVLSPGKTERMVIAEATRFLAELGCLDGIAHITNQAPPYIRPPTNRTIQVDDTIKVQLEFAGPSGYWIELAGIYSFRDPPEQQLQHFATMLKATERAASQMRPGAKARDVSQTIEETYRDDGWNITGPQIWGIHGIGLNLVEPPYGSPDADEDLKENMIIMIGPSAFVDAHSWSAFIPENLVVTPDGGIPLGDHKYEWHVLSD